MDGDDGEQVLSGVRQLRNDFTGFLLPYKFGIDEIMTKINILKEEFEYDHDYSPIEYVKSRLKSPESIVEKAQRISCPLSFTDICANIRDIAGIRITCSFISDAYWIKDMLTSQGDMTVLQVKDYIARPKPNGYKSLHLIVEVPIFMSEKVQRVCAEIQIRTVAMDFWASLEHKIYYKYHGEVPVDLLDELTGAAEVASRLDVKMERLRDEVKALSASAGVIHAATRLVPVVGDLVRPRSAG
ncbi:MAG: GTP pyrophosphokinase family protein [Microbacteriaceae bacterium]